MFSAMEYIQGRVFSENFRNKLIFYSEELVAPRPTPNLEVYPLSAVRDCLLNIFTATFRICIRYIPKAPYNNFLEYFNTKLGRDDVSRLTIGNESLHEITNNNGVRAVNFGT
jgi:hypothetical protein